MRSATGHDLRRHRQPTSSASWATTRWPQVISPFAHAPPELLKGLPKHPIPSLLLARLAVAQSERGQGLGKFLLLDAFDRCLRVAREVAFRAIEVEAIDDRAAAFYAKYGFLLSRATLATWPSPLRPFKSFSATDG